LVLQANLKLDLLNKFSQCTRSGLLLSFRQFGKFIRI